MKTLAISFTEGRVIRDFFENGLIESLQNAGVRLLFFTPAERVPYIRQEWESKGISVFPLLPYSPSEKELKFENLRKRIKRRSARLHHLFLKRYHYFFRTDRQIEEVLTREKCDLVLITNPMYRNETQVWSTAKKLGIPTIGAVRSWDNLHQGLRIYTDQLLVWSGINKQEAVNLMGFPGEAISVIGGCQFDQYFNPAWIKSREAFCRELNLDPSRPIIMLATIGSLWAGYDENYMVDQLTELIASGAIPGRPQLLIRLHPVSKYECFLPYLRHEFVRLSHITRQVPVLGWTMSKDEVGMVGNMLRHADLVISPGSTITLETAIFDTPTLFPTYHTYQPEFGRQCYGIVLAMHHKRLRDLKLANFIEQPEDLLPAILRSLDDRAWFAEERKRLFNDYIVFNDGKSTERLCRVLTSAMQ